MMMMLLVALVVPAVVFGQACSDPPTENACTISGDGACGNDYFAFTIYSDTSCGTATTTSCTKLLGEVTCDSVLSGYQAQYSAAEIDTCFNFVSGSLRAKCSEAVQPTGQPTEQPAGQPAGQPAEQPAEQPTEKPTEKSAAAGMIMFFAMLVGIVVSSA